MTIKNKLMLLSFVIVLIPFLISHFFVYLQSTSTITEEILHHLETVAEYHKQKMKNEIVHNRERLALVSSRTQLRLSLKKFIEDSKKEYQAKMNKILRDACASIPSFKSISVMTLDGKIVASTDASVLGKDASNMGAFVQGKIRHRVDILFLEDERLWLHLAGPLNLDDKKIGVIVIRTEPNSILSAMEDYSVVHKTSEILLAKEDEDGNALFLAPLRFDASAAFRKTVSNSNKNSTIIRALNKQEKVMIDTKDYRGRPVLAVTRYIEDPDWVLVAKIDKDEAFSSLIQLRILLIKVLAVSIVVVLLLSFLLAKSLVEPLKKLTSLASNIGDGIFSQTSGILQNDEIGKLGDEIDLMAVKLNNSQTKLREENEHRKRVEEALRESEHKFSRLFKSSPAGMVIITVAEGSVFDLNDSFERITGYGREESLGCTSLELGFWPKPEDRLKATGLLREYAVFRQQEYAYRHKSGEIKTGLMSAEIIEIQNISFIFTSIEDITERTLMEATIRQNEEKFRQFFENEPAYCYMITPEGNIFDINKAALGVLGYDKEEIIGQPLKMIYAPESLPQMERNFIKWQRSSSLKDEEMTIITKAGNKHTVLLSADAVYDKDQKIQYSISVQKDITKYKELETQFQQAQKMEAIGILAGGVAHDFNNILSIIIGNAGLALMDNDLGNSLREEIEEIKIAGERGAALTRQLLAFSRKQIVRPKILNLNKLFAGMEKMLGRLIGENIEILKIPDPALWQVKIDPGQMEQVIMNLAINARDAMHRGGKLTIETNNLDIDENYFYQHNIEGEPGPYVMLAVSDTGTGMDKETQKHIFEPFYTTKSKGRGTGLGLSTIYGIIKQNSGFVWVYSEPGQGSTFKVYLPKTEEDVATEKKEKSSVIQLGGSETILIVEDDDKLRDLVGTILKGKGYKVLIAENGEAALRVNKEYDGQIDLLLTDVIMPKMNGEKTAKLLEPLHPRMKTIYMSGYTDNAIVYHGVLEAGLNFLQKPFPSEDLMRIVREALDEK